MTTPPPEPSADDQPWECSQCQTLNLSPDAACSACGAMRPPTDHVAPPDR